jgi:ATP-dependent protease HslVU (ClpYQ) ATPase subunit
MGTRRLLCQITVLMSGPAGCGKMEIAGRYVELAHAPFAKVGASRLFLLAEMSFLGEVGSTVRFESQRRQLCQNLL